MTQQNGFYMLKVPFKWKAVYNTLLRPHKNYYDFYKTS